MYDLLTEISCRIDKVIDVASRFSGIGGDHHKQWVIDQMLRSLLSEDDYRDFVPEYNKDEEYPSWDEGIAP